MLSSSGLDGRTVGLKKWSDRRAEMVGPQAETRSIETPLPLRHTGDRFCVTSAARLLSRGPRARAMRCAWRSFPMHSVVMPPARAARAAPDGRASAPIGPIGTRLLRAVLGCSLRAASIGRPQNSPRREGIRRRPEPPALERKPAVRTRPKGLLCFHDSCVPPALWSVNVWSVNVRDSRHSKEQRPPERRCAWRADARCTDVLHLSPWASRTSCRPPTGLRPKPTGPLPLGSAQTSCPVFPYLLFALHDLPLFLVGARMQQRPGRLGCLRRSLHRRGRRWA